MGPIVGLISAGEAFGAAHARLAKRRVAVEKIVE